MMKKIKLFKILRLMLKEPLLKKSMGFLYISNMSLRKCRNFHAASLLVLLSVFLACRILTISNVKDGGLSFSIFFSI